MPTMPEQAVRRESAAFAADKDEIDRAIAVACERYVPEVDGLVGDAIHYGLTGEGKRMRGILFLCAFRAAGGVGDALGLAAAIEIVHAYSLLHDDLPCMDDDDVRRGRPTVHRVFGVAAGAGGGVAPVPLALGAACRAWATLCVP